MVEVAVTSLIDGYGTHLLKYLKQKEFLVLIVCCVAFLLGIPHVMQVFHFSSTGNKPVGIYVFQLMDHYTAIVSIMFLAFFEVVAICWVYGVKRLSQNVIEMTGKKPNIFFTACWTVISPLLVTVILVFAVIQFKPARYESYEYPAWAQGIGWVIAMASIIWIPLGAIHTLWVLSGSFTERLRKSITPFALDEHSKSPYYKEGQGEIYPNIIAITSIAPLPEKPPLQVNT